MSNKVTLEHINSKIAKEEYLFPEGTTLTICILTMQNGYTVTGESACASPDNFNIDLGKKYAREVAIDKIWSLEGYLLREQLHHSRVYNELTENIELFILPEGYLKGYIFACMSDGIISHVININRGYDKTQFIKQLDKSKVITLPDTVLWERILENIKVMDNCDILQLPLFDFPNIDDTGLLFLDPTKKDKIVCSY